MPQVSVLTSRTGTSVKSERGQAFCWSNPYIPRLFILTIFSSATSKTKLTSCGNKQKDTASWSLRLPAALAHHTHLLLVCLSNLLKRFTNGLHPSGAEWSVSSATLTSIPTVHSTFSWTSLRLIWQPIVPLSWPCFLYHLGLLSYPPKHHLQVQVAPVSTTFLPTRNFCQIALRQTRVNLMTSSLKSWGSNSLIIM